MPKIGMEPVRRRALIDAVASAAVALRVMPLPLCEALTIVFHGRRDLGTIQTYVAHGGRGAGAAVAAGIRDVCGRIVDWENPYKRASIGDWTHQEQTILEDNYSFLRKVEHRLQIMFDLQTHMLPTEPGELAKLANQMIVGITIGAVIGMSDSTVA